MVQILHAFRLRRHQRADPRQHLPPRLLRPILQPAPGNLLPRPDELHRDHHLHDVPIRLDPQRIEPDLEGHRVRWVWDIRVGAGDSHTHQLVCVWH